MFFQYLPQQSFVGLFCSKRLIFKKFSGVRKNPEWPWKDNPAPSSAEIPENRGIQKVEIQVFFSVENNSMWMSFGKKLMIL